MAISANDIYRGTIRYVMAGQICVNVLHFRATSGSGTPLQIAGALNALLDRLGLIVDQLRNISHEDVYFDSIEVTGVHGPAGLHQRMRQIAGNGHATGELLPGLVGLPFHMLSDFHGRSRRGRIHVGGWTEADQTAGVLTPQGATKAGTFRTILENQMTSLTSGWQGIIYSRKIAQEQLYGPNSSVWAVEGDPISPWVGVKEVLHGNIFGTVYSRKIGVGS